MTHISVLIEESLAALNLAPRAVAIDATVGQGGHARRIAEAIGKGGTVLALDADESSLHAAKEYLAGSEAHIIFVQGNFRNLKEHAAHAGIGSADAILFDLGWHSGQLMTGRGFSFNEDAPLLMTLAAHPEPHQLTAADIIGNWEEDDLVTLFRELGEERFASRIARAIVEAREHASIQSARELGEIIAAVTPRRGRIHPATRVFQALRMRVNQELESLEAGLQAAFELLAPGARLAVISFHSLEDRVVKRTFKAYAEAGEGCVITKKPIRAGRAEARANPRARSAKLRIFEKKTM